MKAGTKKHYCALENIPVKQPNAASPPHSAERLSLSERFSFSS
jgi:hypothetical protein